LHVNQAIRRDGVDFAPSAVNNQAARVAAGGSTITGYDAMATSDSGKRGDRDAAPAIVESIFEDRRRRSERRRRTSRVDSSFVACRRDSEGDRRKSQRALRGGSQWYLQANYVDWEAGSARITPPKRQQTS
jgi:hypothetical protein